MSDDHTRLIVRYLSNEATPEEQEKLLNWVSSSSENQRTFHQYADTWSKQEMRMPAVNKAAALQAINARIDDIELRDNVRKMYPWWIKVAASVIFLIIAAPTLIYLLRPSSPEMVAVIAPPGQHVTTSLPDGSQVQLNGGSELTYPKTFTGESREVNLTGEAFFNVKRDESRPFIVHSGTINTQVLGTSFDVDSDSTRVIVTVATGSVKVYNDTHSKTLAPRDQVTYHIPSQTTIKSKANLETALAWTHNAVILHDISLGDAIQTLQRQYGITIRLSHEKLAACKITGSFENETPEHILEAISFSTGTTIKLNDDQSFLISGKGCD